MGVPAVPVRGHAAVQPIPQIHQRLAVAHEAGTRTGLGDYVSGVAGCTPRRKVRLPGRSRPPARRPGSREPVHLSRRASSCREPGERAANTCRLQRQCRSRFAIHRATRQVRVAPPGPRAMYPRDSHQRRPRKPTSIRTYRESSIRPATRPPYRSRQPTDLPRRTSLRSSPGCASPRSS